MARLLFVDSDRNLLRQLDLSLRSTQGDWFVATAGGAADATEQLGRQRFDVVLAPSGSRASDGRSFLAVVADQQPTALRIELCEGRGTGTRPDAYAHQHLARPTNGDGLFVHLARTLALTQVLSDPALKSVVGRLRAVPTLPPVYMAIVAEFRKDEVSVRRIGELVAKDAGMSAKILQFVNSAFFGFRVRVTDPVHAVQLLGLDTVRGFVLSAHVFEQLDLRTVTRFHLGRVWRHSLAAAGCLKIIAGLQGVAADQVGPALTATLLHDLGKLVMASALPDDYAVIVDQAEADGSPTWIVEREMIGTTHAEVGAHLLALWGLPAEIVEAVAWHHRPAESLSDQFSGAGAVHAADVIEHRVHPEDAIAAAPEPDLDYLERCHVATQFPAWTNACARDACAASLA